MWADAVPPAIVWAATGYKLTALRGGAPSPAGRALLGTLLWLALATTAFTPPVYRLVDQATGVPNVSILIAQTFGLTLLWPARSLLVYQRHDLESARRIVRRRYRYLPLCLALQATFWAWAAVPISDPQYVLHQADNSRAVAFFAVHHVALFAAGLDAMGPGWRIGSRMQREFRVGLRFVTAAGAGAVTLVAYNTSYFAAALAGESLTPWGDGAVVMALGLHVSTSLLAIGATVPDWGPRLVRWAEAGVALRRLRPLWRDLVAASPGVAPPDSYGALDFTRRLHRRVVEIRDASLTLRAHVPPATMVRSAVLWAGTQQQDRAAFVEATVLAAAARAKASGMRTQQVDSWLVSSAGGADLNTEVEWLSRVAHQYPRAKEALVGLDGTALPELRDALSRGSRTT